MRFLFLVTTQRDSIVFANMKSIVRMDRAFRLTLTVLLLFFIASSARAGSIYTPPSGSPERTAIMNGLRPIVENDMGKPIEFVVGSLKVCDGFAFVNVTPQRPGGRAISLRETTYADSADTMDGVVTYALLQKHGDRWAVLTYVVGPTDLAWSTWADDFGAPKSLFGF